jgi:hypothetical protein
MTVKHRFGRAALLAAVVSAVGVWLAGTSAPAQGDAAKNTKCPQQVLIIRHAEKTAEKTDFHLSAQGKQRAEALDQLFAASDHRPAPFPRPDFIIAASDSNNSHRPLETVAPLAQRLKLPVNHTYDSKLPAAGADGNGNGKAGMLGLRDELFGNPKYFGKTILVSWRHGTIPELAKTLRANNAPATWDDNVFDRVWQITYDDQGSATFADRPQRLLPGDAEK